MSDGPLVYRRAAEADLPEMLRLWREMMDFHARVDPRFRPKPSPEGEHAWERHMREHICGDDDWCVFVAEEDGRMVGHTVGMLREPYPVFEPERFGEVMDIVVDPGARRRGVGKGLFGALKLWFRERGAGHVRLQVAHRNSTSQAFWRSMGCTDYMDTLWYDLGAE